MFVLVSSPELSAAETDHECRFLGTIGSPSPYDWVDPLLDGLQLLTSDEDNPNGWGIAFYPSYTESCQIRIPTVFRGSDPAIDDANYDWAQGLVPPGPKALVAHVRKASSGCVDIPDPHPFVKKKKVFAHNGKIDEDVLLSLIEAIEPSWLNLSCIAPNYVSLGGDDQYVDSDLYFTYLLLNVQDTTSVESVTFLLHQAIWNLAASLADNEEPRKLNMVYTDGSTLWAARYASVSESIFTLYYSADSLGGAVASEPLGNLEWIELDNYQMIRLRPGEEPVIYDLAQEPYLVLSGVVGEGNLELSWTEVPGVSEYWIYGAENVAYFEPGFGPDYEFKLDEVVPPATIWVTPAGVGDPAQNWTYMVIAVNAYEEELGRSNRLGEHDFEGTIP
jgi:predicted glutamine amidotransferase